MVFDRIKKALIPKKRDPFSTQGLEEFSPSEQERILGRIGSKEAELRKQKADFVTSKRLEQLERQLGIPSRNKGPRKSIGERLSNIKSYRQKNLARRAERQRQFAKQEEDFKAGRLKIKPVGNVKQAEANMNRMKSGGKLNVKPIKLKAPSGGMR